MSRFVDIDDRLARADDHIQEIKYALRAYYSSDPYSIAGEVDPDAKKIVWEHVEIAVPPIRIATLAGEVLHNLHSVLDHLAWELVEEGGSGKPNESTYFPILQVPPTPNKKGISPPPYVAGGVSPTASALIERVQPYKLGGNYFTDPLWVLRELSNVDKHRHVTIRGSHTRDTWLAGDTPRCRFIARTDSADEWGAEIHFVPTDPNVDMHFRTTLQVMVHEIGPGMRLPLLDALTAARDTVNAIVKEADATCFG